MASAACAPALDKPRFVSITNPHRVLCDHDEIVFMTIATWAVDGVCTRSVRDIATLCVWDGDPRKIYPSINRIRDVGFIEGKPGAIRPLKTIKQLWEP